MPTGLQQCSTHKPVDDLYLINILLDCGPEQKAHGLLGTVDRCGYGGQQKGTIMMFMDRVHVSI